MSKRRRRCLAPSIRASASAESSRWLRRTRRRFSPFQQVDQLLLGGDELRAVQLRQRFALLHVAAGEIHVEALDPALHLGVDRLERRSSNSIFPTVRMTRRSSRTSTATFLMPMSCCFSGGISTAGASPSAFSAACFASGGEPWDAWGACVAESGCFRTAGGVSLGLATPSPSGKDPRAGLQKALRQG